MVRPLQRVLVRAPDEAFASADPDRWHYAARPDLARARTEHALLVEILHRAGAEIVVHECGRAGLADALFVHDPAIVTDAGAIVLRMGKVLRRGEEDGMAEALSRAGVPIHARLRAPACAEGGDLLWLDRATLAVGLGTRTNHDGLEQLRAAVSPLDVEVIPVVLPERREAGECLHLMSSISMIDDDLAVAHEPALPSTFRELLREREIEVVPVPDEELATMAPNVLALGPRRCLMLAGNPRTRSALESAGCEVQVYGGAEISLKAEGGATCLTRPLWRA